jgi:hypothetical protein
MVWRAAGPLCYLGPIPTCGHEPGRVDSPGSPPFREAEAKSGASQLSQRDAPIEKQQGPGS